MNKKRRNAQAKQPPPAPQLAPVAVVTLTFLPPLDQVGNIQPVFPTKMQAQDVLHILRRAEELLIAQMAQPQPPTKQGTERGNNSPA